MQKCAYPNCQHRAVWTPYVELPTMRSVGESRAMVQTNKPTILLCAEVCQEHRDHYNLTDWINAGDWTAIRELGMEHGYAIPELSIVVVQFEPFGYVPLRMLPVSRN